ncbi:MAG: lactonase family protein [Saonia sp.]
MKKRYAIVLLCSLCVLSCGEKTKSMKMHTLFVGTYTDNTSEGIYVYSFNPDTGELTHKRLAAVLDNPSFLKISPRKKYLYAVQETDTYDSLSGAVTAFVIEKGKLTPIHTMATGGAHPCHIGISEKGDFLAVSNYSGGSTSIFKRTDAGKLLPGKQLLDHTLLDTIKKAHAHAAQFTADGLFVADLGLDAVKRYILKEERFVPAEQTSISLPEKAGPRHFTFGTAGKFLYVINELNATLTVFQKNREGKYAELETQSTLDPLFTGESFCADIHLSKDGKFLYGSNRGENTIVIFKVDQRTGRLTLVGRESVHGNWPRNFTLDPTGNFLLVANQKSDNICVFKRDVQNGTLHFLYETALPDPVCLEFLDF